MSKLVAVLLLAISLEGCPETSKPVPPRAPYQRFLPIAPPASMAGVPWHGNFALDTKTGQLCRTWDWELKDSKGNPLKQEPIWSNLPQCRDLYARYPD